MAGAGRTGQRSVGAEGEVGAGIDPGGLRAGRVGIGLIEQVPGIGVRDAERSAVGLGPAQLQVDRRSRRIVGRDRAAADGFVR